MLTFWLYVALLLTALVSCEDKHEQCREWAERGECDSNPNYMIQNCADSCEVVAKEQTQGLEHVSSFYDLQAYDLQNKLVKFEEFRGKVVILTNVASFCGYTESHYKSLVNLWSVVKDENVEILAFPCNQFGAQEPKQADEIALFARNKGVEFRMMQKIDVNGANAHDVYRYLKLKAGPRSIEWNFATYFVVSPMGEIESHSGVEPLELQPRVQELLAQEEEL